MTSKENALIHEGKDLLMNMETTLLVLDCSGSMDDMIGRRDNRHVKKISILRETVAKMLRERLAQGSKDIVGVVTFGHGATNDLPEGMSIEEYLMEQFEEMLVEGVEAEMDDHLSYGQVGVSKFPTVLSESDIQDIESDIEAMGSTPMLAGIKLAIRLLDDQAQGLARIILVSDGSPTDRVPNPKLQIKDAVRSAAEELGIVTDTIAIGSSSYSYDAKFMKDVAEAGEGEFYEVRHPDDLDQLMKRLGSERQVLLGEGIRLLAANAGE